MHFGCPFLKCLEDKHLSEEEKEEEEEEEEEDGCVIRTRKNHKCFESTYGRRKMQSSVLLFTIFTPWHPIRAKV
jgi:hypothetical protein